jgi:hypothetical protein
MPQAPAVLAAHLTQGAAVGEQPVVAGEYLPRAAARAARAAAKRPARTLRARPRPSKNRCSRSKRVDESEGEGASLSLFRRQFAQGVQFDRAPTRARGTPPRRPTWQAFNVADCRLPNVRLVRRRQIHCQGPMSSLLDLLEAVIPASARRSSLGISLGYPPSTGVDRERCRSRSPWHRIQSHFDPTGTSRHGFSSPERETLADLRIERARSAH